jgi:proteasome lid subunit RPN8/RPN11
VIPVTPAELQIDRQALTVLIPVLREPAPREGCALLLGRRLAGGGEETGPPWRLERIWPCLNVWQPAAERLRRFRLDPREQMQAQRWARRRGLEVLGAAHSHPADAPTPSSTDLTLTTGPTVMLILGQATPGTLAEGALGCWWIRDGHDPEDPGGGGARPLLWRMVD